MRALPSFAPPSSHGAFRYEHSGDEPGSNADFAVLFSLLTFNDVKRLFGG